MNIGRITKEQYLKEMRRLSREDELEQNGGWTAKNKVHKSDKEYSRKPKHKKGRDEYDD